MFRDYAVNMLRYSRMNLFFRLSRTRERMEESSEIKTTNKRRIIPERLRPDCQSSVKRT